MKITSGLRVFVLVPLLSGSVLAGGPSPVTPPEAVSRPIPERPRASECPTPPDNPIVTFTVTKKGSVSAVSFVRRSGCRVFDEAVERNVHEWRFKPAQQDGKAIDFKMTSVINQPTH